MQFDIEFQADHLSSVMDAIRREIATPEEMLGSIGASLFQVNQERHDQGLDPEGKAWEKLAASTIAAGGRKGGPLNKTGRMLANFHYQVQGDNLRLGFDQGDGFKAIFHQDGSRAHVISRSQMVEGFGSVRRRINHPGLPARPLVGFPESDRQLVGDVTADHITAVINRRR
jgi:phage gpG-like protein